MEKEEIEDTKPKATWIGDGVFIKHQLRRWYYVWEQNMPTSTRSVLLFVALEGVA